MTSRTLVAAFQGEAGAFGEQAARRFFGRRAGLKPVETFEEVFRFASNSPRHLGIVPIENSLYGSIHQSYDLLLAHALHIVGEVKLRIELHLAALPGVRLSEISEVYSQPQALGQCEDFFRSLKGVKPVAFEDTAGAARMVREVGRRHIAAIASADAIRRNRLAVIRRNVENHRSNFTRFIVLSKNAVSARIHPKTSLAFALRDKPGALFRALAVFALRDVNLLKIESRPIQGKPWQYLFYLDVEGSHHDDALGRALEHLKELAIFTRVLGTYESGESSRSTHAGRARTPSRS